MLIIFSHNTSVTSSNVLSSFPNLTLLQGQIKKKQFKNKDQFKMLN